jgi:uncharacterized membrane protein YfcA
MVSLSLVAALSGLAAGFILGFLGAGGTVVALPILLYLGRLRPHLTLGTNALGVSVIAAALLIWRTRAREVRLLDGIVFAAPGLVGIYLGSQIGMVYPGKKLIFLLGILMFFIAAWMFYLSTQTNDSSNQPIDQARELLSARKRLSIMVVVAVAIGLVAGFFGIGGGFMIVPALIIVGGLDLNGAAATALLPIASFAALVGVGYFAAGDANIEMAVIMLLAGVLGGAGGIWLSKRLPKRAMQIAFAVFLTALGLYIILG